ncbi:MAG: aspartate carbamoyltransferase catalytic subunit [Leisingera sp.]
MNSTDSWAGILDDGEDIIWQGRPEGGISMRPFSIFEAVFGLFFAGFALFWMTQAAKAGGSFWMFGLLHFSVGVGIVFHAVLWSAFVRRNSWYTLTNRRAFIATSLPLMGRRLKSYPLTGDTPLELVDGQPASVFFAERTKRGKNGSYTVPVGFERIAEGREVYRMMREIQAEALKRKAP